MPSSMQLPTTPGMPPKTPPAGYPPGSTYNSILGKWMLPPAVPKTQEQLDAAAREENDRTRALEYERRDFEMKEGDQRFQQAHAGRELGLAERTDDRRYRMARKGARDSASLAALVASGGGSTSGGGGGTAPGAGGAPATAPSAATAAQDAGYARLKEREGLRLRSGINTAKASLGRRGLTGSSFESPAIAALVGESNANLADYDAAALSDTVGRARQVEDRDFAAGEQRNRSRLEMLLSLIQGGRTAY